MKFCGDLRPKKISPKYLTVSRDSASWSGRNKKEGTGKTVFEKGMR